MTDEPSLPADGRSRAVGGGSDPSGLFDRLVDIAERDLSVDRARCHRDADLVADLLFDSLAFAIGIVAIEEELAVRLDEGQLVGCTTFGELEDLVRAELRAAGETP